MSRLKLSKKAKKIITILIGVPILLILLLLAANRVFYGTWDGYPNRITVDGFYYYNQGDYVTLTGAEKPQYEISGILDKITGKRVYSDEKDFKPRNGSQIYLYIEGDKYLQLNSTGGG